jgi:hypothetical protein
MDKRSLRRRVAIGATSFVMLFGASVATFANPASAVTTGKQQFTTTTSGQGTKVFGCIREPAKIILVRTGIPPKLESALVPAHLVCGRVI